MRNYSRGGVVCYNSQSFDLMDFNDFSCTVVENPSHIVTDPPSQPDLKVCVRNNDYDGVFIEFEIDTKYKSRFVNYEDSACIMFKNINFFYENDKSFAARCYNRNNVQLGSVAARDLKRLVEDAKKNGDVTKICYSRNGYLVQDEDCTNSELVQRYGKFW